MKKTLYLCSLVLFILFFSGCSASTTKFDSSEAVAYTSLRLAISKSKTGNSGEISKTYLDKLKNIIKKANNNNQWFENYEGNFYGITKDTSDYQIDFICNENYCAKFTVKNTKENYYLEDYSFETNNENGYNILITD